MNDLRVVVDPLEAIPHQLGILVRGDPVEPVVLGPAERKRLRDAQSAVGELLARGKHDDVDGVAEQASQPKQALERGDTTPGDDYMETVHCKTLVKRPT